MAVDTRIQPTFVNGKTTPLPIEGLISTGPRNYDIMPDGKFIVVVAASSTGLKAPTAQFSVTLNWFEELKRKVPLKRVCTHCAGSLARSVMGFDNFRSSAVRQF